MKKDIMFNRLMMIVLLVVMLAASQMIAVVCNINSVKVIKAESETENTEKFVTVTEETIVMREDYGTFVLDHNVTQDKWRAAVFGNVKLILKDGCTWEIKEGIHLAPNSTLNIYGDSENTGTLLISKPRIHYSGIGGDEEQNAGNLNVYGGIVDVTGGLSAAAIGGGFKGNGGEVNIYGGTVVARSRSYGAGIGSGSAEDLTGLHSGNITIHGGEVFAYGGTAAAGIGGGWGASCDTVRITGGSVTAIGGEPSDGKGGAGIGTGSNSKNLPNVSAGTVIIEDGVVNATGTENAAGIGGGQYVNGGTVNIFDGDVTAKGGECGAGIGGGEDRDGGNVNIVGGTVRAEGGRYAAGIGGGEGGNQGNKVTVSAGIVTATGGEKGAGIGGGQNYYGGGNGDEVEVNGGSLTATGGKYAAGIGGGDGGDGGEVTINAGTVIANAGEEAAGIGGGEGGDGGVVNINGGEVTATGREYGAGIGGGDGGDGCIVTVNGGKVIANGGEDAAGIGGGEGGDGVSFIINDGEVTATGNSYGAGIGGGESEEAGTIMINGGRVVAYGGDDGNSLGLGHGGGGNDEIDFGLYDKARVYAGNNKGDLAAVLNDRRASEATSKKYVIVEKCQHDPDQYDKSEQGHQCTCTYCNESASGVVPHIFGEDHKCTICGYKAATCMIKFLNYDDSLLKEIEVEMQTLPVYDGQTPQKPKEGDQAFRFVSWDPEIVAATKDASYKAVFEAISDHNTVTWVDYDDSVLEVDSDVKYGTMPEYNGETPEERKQGQYINRFKGWDPELSEVTGDITYKAVYEKIRYLYTASFDMNNADSEAIRSQELKAGETISRPEDPIRNGYSFAGWYLSDKYSSKWNFATEIKGDVVLKAQWIEESYETTINDTDVRVTMNDLSGKDDVSDLYSDLPLLVKTENGYVFIPAHTEGTVSIPDRRDPSVKADIISSFRHPETDGIYAVYLTAKKTDQVDEKISDDTMKNGYEKTADSGVDIELHFESITGNGEITKHEVSGRLSVLINLKELGITLEDCTPDMIRTYYMAHNYDGENVEYLVSSISADKTWAAFTIDKMSPFALVYRDSKKPQPQPAYIIPVTGQNDKILSGRTIKMADE